MSNINICEVVEPQSDTTEYTCHVCGVAYFDNLPKNILELFIKNNPPEFKGTISEFERQIDFVGVFKYKCFGCGHNSHNVYVNSVAALSAWYDCANEIGFIKSFDSH